MYVCIYNALRKACKPCLCDVSWSVPCTSLFYDAHCNIDYALMER